MTLQAALELGMPLTEQVVAGAVRAGQSEKVHWLLDEKLCILPDDAAAEAASEGSVSMLKWLKQRVCAFDKNTFLYAAVSGRIEALEYLHSVDCPWSECCCAVAATSGHLAALQWLHEHGCPWSALELLRQAIAQDCTCIFMYIVQQQQMDPEVLAVLRDPDAVVLTELLAHAGAYCNLKVAKWIAAQEHARWPEVLRYASDGEPYRVLHVTGSSG